MIIAYRKVFEDHREELVEKYTQNQNEPGSYEGIVRDVIELLHEHVEEYGDDIRPDPKRVTVIDHGDYQGTILFIIGATGYQPSQYLSVFVGYGSCSGCDAFQSISDSHYEKKGEDWDSPLTPAGARKRAEAYLGLANDVVNGLKVIGDE